MNRHERHRLYLQGPDDPFDPNPGLTVAPAPPCPPGCVLCEAEADAIADGAGEAREQAEWDEACA